MGKFACAPECAECEIPWRDGYSEWCKKCSARRWSRRRRGERYTPNGYAGEAIDNDDPRGRIVAYP